ncbi:cellulose biosynthesis protein BcsN [Microvirga thermotolerans]|uniref:Cellulose biosynthesis protein BcsN n=1 Tax=Microvirga thermotolerans TaxID=2651334 RepID=A0A5P9JVT2_9HYPH|nr:cellulose biosynthesis protein BcsN [Microvirga thermotolerans]QFU15295.1 cellulose biosynthesis protein BcsN [Microvirga thermotolerans]
MLFHIGITSTVPDARPRRDGPRGSARRVVGAFKALSIAIPAVLAGCSTQSELRFATPMTEVPASKALILPPPGGPAVVAVLQRTYRNGVSQEIALSTASAAVGQNAFYVSLVNDLEVPSENDDVLKIRPISPDRIQSEMDERVPGVDMRTSLFYVQNKYGPFGFATGRSAAGDVCLYAWQRIEPNKPAILTPGGIVSVRLRLCDADATEEQLLRTMYAFTISAYYSSVGWNPYGEPPPVPPHLGGLDAPLFPIGMAAGAATDFGLGTRSPPPAERMAPAPRPAAPRPRARPVPSAPLPSAPPAEPRRPLEGYPVVPPPP